MSHFITDYDDEDLSCSRTFCALRLFSVSTTPEQISEVLRIEPTKSHRVGELISPRGTARRSEHHWHLSTESAVASRDFRRHVDWLLERLYAAESAFEELRAKGMAADIFVYWRSARGQGGPLLSVPQLKGLAKLELECVFDIYFDETEASHPGDRLK